MNNDPIPKSFKINADDRKLASDPHALLLGLVGEMAGIRNDISNIKDDVKDNKELMKAVVIMQTQQQATNVEVVELKTELKTRSEQIDENKAEIKLLRSDVATLQTDLIKNGEYRMTKAESFQGILVRTTLAGLSGLATAIVGFVNKDLLLQLFHRVFG